MKFDELVKRSRKTGQEVYQGTLLSLDPGHTTGWAVFVGTELSECGELRTPPASEGGDDRKNLQQLQELLSRFDPNEVVIEDYRVYKWRATQHANSELHTTKLIGLIQAACIGHGVVYYTQTAHMAKGFADDKKLREWEYYVEGYRHARDAIRHACYFIAFGPREVGPKSRGRKVG